MRLRCTASRAVVRGQTWRPALTSAGRCCGLLFGPCVSVFSCAFILLWETHGTAGSGSGVRCSGPSQKQKRRATRPTCVSTLQHGRYPRSLRRRSQSLATSPRRVAVALSTCVCRAQSVVCGEHPSPPRRVGNASESRSSVLGGNGVWQTRPIHQSSTSRSVCCSRRCREPLDLWGKISSTRVGWLQSESRASSPPPNPLEDLEKPACSRFRQLGFSKVGFSVVERSGQ